MTRSHRRCTRLAHSRRGFTLIELIVVLAIMSLAAAVVIPALSRTRTGPTIQSILVSARDAAARRGETVYLHIAPSGAWRMEGGRSSLETDAAGGRIDPIAAAPVTILVAPGGSCAFDVRSAAAARGLTLRTLDCTLAVPKPRAAPAADVTASSS